MVKIFYYLSRFWAENGTVVTSGLLNLGVICFCFWKLFTNHLKHIEQNIKANGVKIETLDKDVNKLGKKVAKIEGKLEK